MRSKQPRPPRRPSLDGGPTPRPPLGLELTRADWEIDWRIWRRMSLKRPTGAKRRRFQSWRAAQ